jgi:ribosomal protein L13
MWAAVPFGKKFMIIHNGEQIHVTGTLATAKSYINKQLKVSKTVKSSTSSLEEFL